jgi:hypothetical protein
MAFITRCPFCKVRAKVPDRALGASGHCPRCANYFTVAPVDDRRLPEGHSHPESEGDEEAVPHMSLSMAIAAAAVSLDGHRPAKTAASGDSVRSAPRAGSHVAPESVLGATALLLGGGALLCASFPALCLLVRPLSAIGLLVGCGAVMIAQRSARPRRLMPAIGSGAAVVVLGAALLLPAVLGPTYERSRQRAEPVSATLQPIPLAGAAQVIQDSDWVDAARCGVKQGNLEIEVVRASVGPLPSQTKAASKRGPDLLLIRLRTWQVQSGRSSRGTPISQLVKQVANRPTLTDPAGTAYPLEDVVDLEPVGAGRRSPPSPVIVADVILAFARPRDGWESLRLTVPVAPWAGTGTFRFMIPVRMFASGS